jgi:hypothetical protein
MEKYKIIDLQGAGFRKGLVFNSKKEVIESLQSLHEDDWSGEKPLAEVLQNIPTEQGKLDWLCDYGDWEIKEA